MHKKPTECILSVFLSVLIMVGIISAGMISAEALTSYNINDGSITVSSEGDYEISGTGDITTNSIVVAANAGTVNITLINVNIDVSATTNTCAFSIGTGTTVNLTLSGTNTLKSGANCAGLNVSSGATLNISGTDTDNLTATGGQYGAGIGGGLNGDGGTINIAGAAVTATGGDGTSIIGGGAGIGGGGCEYGVSSGGGAAVRITVGTVTATGGANGGAGIGGGSCGSGASVEISGGTVIAYGGSYGAAIGGGDYYSSISVDISGNADVTATGGDYGAGIGGGNRSGGGTIIISGGTISAQGGKYSAGIGGGSEESGGTFDISGGEITATGKQYGAGIGGGLRGDCGIVTIEGDAVVIATGDQGGAGIGGGSEGGDCAGSEINIGGNAQVTASTTSTSTYICSAGIGGGYKGSGTAVTISDNATVRATGGMLSAGIGNGNANGVSSYVSGSCNINGGTVIAQGGSQGAGIGGAAATDGGEVTITGGYVTATGGLQSAGIGGGYHSSYSGTGGEVTITDGTVIATGNNGYGIGGAKNSTFQGSCIISGGSVLAVNSMSPAGMGPTPTLDGTTVVYSTTVTVGTSEVLGVSEVTYTVDSGATKRAFTDASGKLYLWLPVKTDGNDTHIRVLSSSKAYKGTGTVTTEANSIDALEEAVISASATTGLVYDGSSKLGYTAAVTGSDSTDISASVSLTDVYYSGSTAVGTPLSGAPTGVGDYTVIISLESTSYIADSKTVSFSIAKAAGLTLISDTPQITADVGAGASAAHTFDLSTLTLSQTDTGTVNYTLGTIIDSDSILNGSPTLTGSVVSVSLNASAQVAGLTASIPITISTPNYNDLTITLTILTIIEDNVAPAVTVPAVTASATGLDLRFSETVTAVEGKTITISDGADTYTYTIDLTNYVSGEGTACKAAIPLTAFINGSSTLTLDSTKTYTVTVEAGAYKDIAGNDLANVSLEMVVAPKISPVTGSFDRNPANQIDVQITVTWGDATGVTDVKAGGISIGTGNYNISGNTLTIKKEYLAAQATGSLALTVEFDAGDAATLTISITDTTPPVISPVSRNYDLNAPADVMTVITWNSAVSVTDAVYSISPDTTLYTLDMGEYTVSDNTLTIKNRFFSGLSLTTGVTFDFEFTFNTGAAATLTVDVVNGYTPSSNADLSSLSVNGTPVSGFDSDDTEYDVELPRGTSSAIVSAMANDPNAQISITQASSLPGSAIVTVTAEDGTTSRTYTINLTIAAPITTYTVTFNSNGSVYDTKTVNAGTSIGSAAWPADPAKSSYTFGGWFTGENGSGTQFIPTTPVNATMTVYAKWTYNGGSSDDDSDSSDDRSTSPTPATPDYNANVNAGNGTKTTIPVTVDKDAGSASVDTGSLSFNQGGTIITIPSIPDVDTYTLGIPVSKLRTPDKQGEMTFKTDNGSVTVPSNMLTGVSGISGSKAEISISQGDKEGLPSDVRAAIGDRPLISLALSINGKQTEWNNANAPVMVSLPYTPTATELLNPESIVIWYIDSSGNVVSIPNGHYDLATGMVTFSTTHFSDYAVAYNKVSFNDVAAARGITNR